MQPADSGATSVIAALPLLLVSCFCAPTECFPVPGFLKWIFDDSIRSVFDTGVFAFLDALFLGIRNRLRMIVDLGLN